MLLCNPLHIPPKITAISLSPFATRLCVLCIQFWLGIFMLPELISWNLNNRRKYETRAPCFIWDADDSGGDCHLVGLGSQIMFHLVSIISCPETRLLLTKVCRFTPHVCLESARMCCPQTKTDKDREGAKRVLVHAVRNSFWISWSLSYYINLWLFSSLLTSAK